MLKAMAYGSCILALDTRFNREMLQDDKFGLFFSKNEDSIAALILDIESMPVESQRMKYASSKGITARYTWDHVAEQYIEVFNKLRPQRKK
mgnify:FL=1